MKKEYKYVLVQVIRKNGKDFYIIPVLKEYKDLDIKDSVETFIDNIGWMKALESYRVEYNIIKIPPKKELLDKWKKLCDKKNRVNENWEIMRLKMLNAK